MRETIQRYEASRYSGMIHNDNGPWVRYSDHIERIAKAEARNKVLEEALTRLRDCDWVITPHDRMDAVREIARAALREDR